MFALICPECSAITGRGSLNRFAIVARAINTLAPNGALKSKHGLGPYIIGHTIQPHLGNQETTKQGESLHLLSLVRRDILDFKIQLCAKPGPRLRNTETNSSFMFDAQKLQLCMVSLMVIDRIRAGSHNDRCQALPTG